MTLTSDLVFRIIMSGAYLLYYLRWGSQIWCVDASWDGRVCRVPLTGHCDLKLELLPRFENNYICSISLILFEVGIPNLVCECILELRIVPFHFPVTVTLT